MIIDAHAHIYPEKISQAAVQSISDFYEIPVPNKGTLSYLLSIGDDAGIDKFLVHSVATAPAQVPTINHFILTSVNAHPDRLIGFMAMHQDYEHIREEIDRCIEAGLKGIKLHPDFQKFAIDDPKVYPIYEAAEGRIPILFHTGDHRYAYSHPKQLKKMMQDFPNLKVIGAHFGGWSEWNEAAEVLKDQPNLWVDCSSSRYAMSDETFRSLIDTFGAERVLFASDYPMWDPKSELEYLRNLQLPQDQMDKILYKNISQLLAL